MSCGAQTDNQGVRTAGISINVMEVQKTYSYDQTLQSKPVLSVMGESMALTDSCETVMSLVDSVITKYGFLKRGKDVSSNLKDSTFEPTNVIDIVRTDKSGVESKYLAIVDADDNRLYVLAKDGKRLKETPIADCNLAGRIISIALPAASANADTAQVAVAEPEFDIEEYLRKRKETEAKVLSMLDGCKIESAYLVDPQADKAEKIQGFSIIDKSKENPKPALVSLLCDTASYVNSNIVNNCAFMPDVAFVVEKNGQRVEFLLSFYCQAVVFYTPEEQVRRDFSPKYDEILKAVIEYFPTDNYIKHYIR